MVLLVTSAASAPGGQSGACSNATLRGEYGFTITGQILLGPLASPVTGVAMTSFDGEGNLAQVDDVLHNGHAGFSGGLPPAPIPSARIVQALWRSTSATARPLSI